ncbi:MAG: hypothetical protein M0R77_12870 [Gammaproteobacteria bacterium]|nr:hypothetical protein [Gammaproteobacteria bacterium]
MKKMVAGFFVSFMAIGALAGCGDTRFSSKESRTEAAQERIERAQIVCRDHVEYLSFPNSYGRTYTAHLQVDGKPYTC